MNVMRANNEQEIVDGETDLFKENCIYIRGWWKVDLKKDYLLTSIKVYNWPKQGNFFIKGSLIFLVLYSLLVLFLLIVSITNTSFGG